MHGFSLKLKSHLIIRGGGGMGLVLTLSYGSIIMNIGVARICQRGRGAGVWVECGFRASQSDENKIRFVLK